MNIVVQTKDEWQAFRLVLEVIKQANGKHRIIVWDDFSEPSWVEKMRQIAEVKQDALNRHFGEHRNRVKKEFPEGEWILMLDADEWIQPGFIEALNAQMVDCAGVDVMFIERRNTFWYETGSPVPPPVDYSVRFRPDFQGIVFRNVAGIYYERHVHEGLTGWQWPLYLRGSPFTLIHHKKDGSTRYQDLVDNPPK